MRSKDLTAAGIALLILVGIAWAAQPFMWDDGSSIWDDGASIWDPVAGTATPTETPGGPTRTPTATFTPTQTGSRTPSTFTPTSTFTATPTATNTPTPFGGFTPSFTPTPTSASQATNTATPTSAIGCTRQLHNRMPRQDSTFLKDAQNMWCDEDGDRFGEQFNSFVVSGSDGDGDVTTWVPETTITAYIDGFYLTETASVPLSAHYSTTCVILLSSSKTQPYSGWTRVSGTYYAYKCGGTKDPNPPVGTMYLASVIFNSGGSIDQVKDISNGSPWSRTVESTTELAALSNPHNGEFGIVRGFDSTRSQLYVFALPSGWMRLSDEYNAVTLTDTQSISGTKTFTSLPRSDGDTPTNSNELVPKSYVDSHLATSGTALYDMTALVVGGVDNVLVTGIPGLTTSHTCTATYDQLTNESVLISAHPQTADTGAGGRARVVIYNAGSSSLDLPLGTIYVRCFQ